MANSAQYGSFVPTNLIWDVQQLYQADVTSPEFKELLVRLYQNVNNIALILNIKDTGMYNTSEFVNGQVYFSNPANNSSTAAAPALRQVYRTVINFGQLPDTGTKSVAHGISTNSALTFTRIYGAASDASGLNYIPLPYASASGMTDIELNADSDDVNVITASNRENFNVSYIILEYLKN
jgi:hypothetical protein